MKKFLAIFLVMVFVFSAMVGCAPATPADEAAPAAETASTAEAEPTAPTGTVKLGIVTAVTGNNNYVGERELEGANLAVEQINAAGGVNGQMLELVVADEVDNLEMSVLATQELLTNDEISGIIGSVFSAWCLAANPSVLEAEVPYMCLGSSSAVSKDKNPYTWQIRPLDTAQGKVIAEFVVNELGCKNPAIMYSTSSTYLSLHDNTVAALAELGVTITEKNDFAFPNDESNYAPYVSQVLVGGFDCLIAMTDQAPGALVCQQAAAGGLTPDVMPLIGSPSYASELTIANAGGAANGWYSISDWVPNGNSETAEAFEKAYLEANPHREITDLNSVSAYDSVYVFAAAMEAAGTNTDREAINNAMQNLDFEGAMSHFSFHEDHSFACSLFVTKNVDGLPQTVDAIRYR